MNCFRYFGFKSLKEVDELTFDEYELLLKSAALKQVDIDYRNHLQAYLNFVVKAERKAGKNKTKPVYSTFRKFFDYDKEIGKVMNPKRNRFEGIAELLKKGGREDG